MGNYQNNFKLATLCTNSKEPPDFKNLFHDHSCGPIAFKTSPATYKKLPNAGRVPPRGTHGPSHPAAWSSVRHQKVNAGPNCLTAPNLKHSLPEAGGVPPLRTDGPSLLLAAQHRASLAERMANPFSVPHQMVTAGPAAPNSEPLLLWFQFILFSTKLLLNQHQ
ncbi:protein TOPLESS-RELATED PROTEIN 2-like [Argentina anserina]|uniref:protein TOPLESS-RELATED PROTEIN 2-like n=1 Tax=Argentina anserina TaxID=57926 RepID=UPI00217672A6|nr:protein TOPLESS-RELATED PROTEIN 2-like [Potentilla anserina]